MVGHNGGVLSCKFLSENFMISGGSDASVCVWDMENPHKYLSIYTEHSSDVVCMAVFEEDANIFLTGSSDLTSKIWDIRVKSPVQKTLYGHESSINTVAFLPKKITTFASGSEDSSIRLYDIRIDREIGTFRDKLFDTINDISFSKSGRLLFAGTENTSVKVWDILGPGSIQETFEVGHTKMIKCC